MWVAWLTAAAALQTRTVLLRSPSIRMSSIGDEQPTFTRGIDLLQTSDAVTARQIVNVLGRWGSHRDWNEAIGRKGKLDELRSGDFYDDDVQTLKTDFSQPMEYYIPRRPQFLNFCERYGLVARWVHGDNVGELPFTDAKLAASIGATVEELNAEPVDPLAADVVFDALSGSAAGFVLEEECDARRASFLTGDGGFDASAFASALGDTRRNLLGVYIFGPGIGVLAAALVAYRWLPELLEGTAQFTAQVERNVEAGGPLVLVVPLLALAALAAQAVGFTPAFERGEGGGLVPLGSMLNEPSKARPVTPVASNADGGAASTGAADGGAGGRPLSWQEMAIRKQDELFLERMLAKRRGTIKEAADGEAEETPKIDDDAVRLYFEKQWAGGIKAIFPFLP